MHGQHIEGGAAHEDGEEEAGGRRSAGNLRNVTGVPWLAAPDDDIGESMMCRMDLPVADLEVEIQRL